MFWQHRQFQDRAVNLWQAIATHYRDEPAVAGYNLLNEPADESRSRGRTVLPSGSPPPSERSTPTHIHLPRREHLLHRIRVLRRAGAPAPSTRCTTMFPRVWAVAAGYPGSVDGVYYDRDVVLKKFLDRSEFARSTGTPLMVGEFGPIYTGRSDEDEQRLRLLADQLAIYDEYQSGWTLWTYKDVGKQGLVTVLPESPYLNRFGDFIAKKDRLGADKWGSDGEGVAAVTGPVQDLIATGVSELRPLPVGPHRLGADPAAQHPVRPAPRLRIRRPDARSRRQRTHCARRLLRLANCVVREPLLARLQDAL